MIRQLGNLFSSRDPNRMPSESKKNILSHNNNSVSFTYSDNKEGLSFKTLLRNSFRDVFPERFRTITNTYSSFDILIGYSLKWPQFLLLLFNFRTLYSLHNSHRN
jgi:hypothetical protein